MDIVREIIELLRLLDMPTAYLMIATPAWLVVLTVLVIIFRKKDGKIFKILAFVPLIHFAVFFLFNFTRGFQRIGIARFGPHLAAALIYLLASLIIAKGKHKIIPLVISGFLAAAISCWTAVYVLAFGSAYHFGNFSHPGYERSMELLIDELEKNYILRDYKEIDFDSLRATYIPLASEAQKNKDEAAFAQAVAELCYEFHDGHLSLRINDSELADEVSAKMAGNDYGFSMIRTDDGKVLAILTDEDSDAYNKGIRDGVEITSWDGREINEAIADVRCVASDLGMLAYPIADNEDVFKPMFLAGTGGDEVCVRFISSDGIEKEVSIKADGSYYDRLMTAASALNGKWCDEFAYAEMLDEHCGYLCIPRESFDDTGDIEAALNDDYPEVRELLISRIEDLKSQGMDRLIIDIRDNDGGIDVVYEEVVSLFTTEDFVCFGGFHNGEYLEASDKWAWVVQADGRYSDIPVVVLVNAGCASSGDLLAYRLSQCNNVTLMGITTTWGSAQALGGEVLLSGGKISVRYPIIATLDSDGSVLVDAGPDRKSNIELDVKIPLDENAVYIIYTLGADYELTYARHYLNGSI